MKFTPKTEKEIREEGLLPSDKYDFTVVSAVEGKSKAGNPMITLSLRVFFGEREVVMKDYLVLNPDYQKKLFDFCKAVGLEKDFAAGNLDCSKMEGKSAQVFIGVQEDKSGQFSARNSVKYYVVPKETKKPEPPDDLDMGEPVPF